jgi:hypothetical protein
VGSLGRVKRDNAYDQHLILDPDEAAVMMALEQLLSAGIR